MEENYIEEEKSENGHNLEDHTHAESCKPLQLEIGRWHHLIF